MRTRMKWEKSKASTVLVHPQHTIPRTHCDAHVYNIFGWHGFLSAIFLFCRPCLLLLFFLLCVCAVAVRRPRYVDGIFIHKRNFSVINEFAQRHTFEWARIHWHSHIRMHIRLCHCAAWMGAIQLSYRCMGVWRVCVCMFGQRGYGFKNEFW